MAELGNKPFGRAGLMKYLAELDAELVKAGREHVVDLLMIGGSAITSMWDSRLTHDADVVNQAIPSDVVDAIAVVGLRNDIGRGWLNDEPRLHNTPVPTGPVALVYRGRVINVTRPEATYLLASKLNAARMRDRTDAIRLAMHLGVHTERDLFNHLATSQFVVEKPKVRDVKMFVWTIADDVDKLLAYRAHSEYLESIDDDELRSLLKKAARIRMVRRADED